MPVEIRELLIKAYVEDAQGENASSSGEVSDKEEIIADCMEQISELLKDQLER
ncbi:DUF5908 family protein [Aliikangiella coralliicola]|uniref:DUF5908 family protein n=1 Tax=Aliikangiella coralliicola TaxID=2592383 RepID=UPI00143D35F9|nr:DUF5908 family protein [Aliikangiella coralliicola]